MATITWQNVHGPSLADSSNILSAAGRSMNAGVDILDRMIQKRNDIASDNWDATKRNNTQEYLDTVAQAKTLGDLSALEQSGRLTGLLDSYGKQVDKSKTGGALAAQLAALRQATTAENTFNDSVIARTETPIINSFSALIADKQYIAAREAIKNSGIRDTGKYLEAVNAAERTGKNQDNADQLSIHNMAAAKLTAEELQRQATNNAEDRAIQADITAAASGHNAKKAETLSRMGVIAKRLGLLTTPAGTPDYDNMNSTQKRELNHQGILNNVITTSPEFGDTKAASQFLAQLIKEGKHNPAAIERNMAAISKFGQTGVTPMLGNDRSKTEQAVATDTVMFDEQNKDNWYAPGSANALNAYDKISQRTKDLVEPGQLRPVNKQLYEIATQGLELPDGTKVVPSENDILAAIQSTEDTWGWNNHADNIKKLLIERLSTPEAKAKFIASEKSLAHSRKQAIAKELQTARTAK